MVLAPYSAITRIVTCSAIMDLTPKHGFVYSLNVSALTQAITADTVTMLSAVETRIDADTLWR